MPNTAPLKKLENLSKNIEFCLFTTRGLDGKLMTHPMAMVGEINLVEGFYFFTRDNTPKAKEIIEDEHVSISLHNAVDKTYISFAGKARVFQDWNKINQLWTPHYKTWFPEGLDDEHLCLIHVKLEEAEYWESPSSNGVKVANISKLINAYLLDEATGANIEL